MIPSATQPGYDLAALVTGIGIVVAATLVLAMVIILVRRWMKAGNESCGATWTLDELTALRDSGDLTIEQYGRLRSELFL